jgi:aspartate aminotransferase
VRAVTDVARARDRKAGRTTVTVSHLARSIRESATLALNERAKQLADRGQPVIHLGGGEPKNKAPLSAIVSASARLTTGDVKYAPADGTPALKQAIIRYTEEHYGRVVAPENVIVSSGAKQSIYNALLAIVDPQDEVVILAPYWVSYPEMVRMVHGQPVIVTPEDGSFVPRLDEVETALSPYTKAVIVNSPNNPTGAVYPPELVEGLVALCEERGVHLLMDDIYHRLVFDDARAEPAYAYTDRDVDESTVIVVNGVSKLYGMTGFRIGWTIAPAPLVEVLKNVQAQTTSCPAAVSMAAAEGALTGVQSSVESLRLGIQNLRDVMLQELRAFEGVRVEPPKGTFYCLPDFRAISEDSEELSRILLDKGLVVTVPGKEFGAEGHLRLSYCGSTKDVTEGVRRMRWALDPTAPNEIVIGDRRLVRDWL